MGLIAELSGFLLETPYIKVELLEDMFKITHEELLSYFDHINNIFSKLEIEIDYIELDKVDYFVISKQSNQKILNEVQIGILSIFGLLHKYGRTLLTNIEKELISNVYSADLIFLEQHNYLSQTSDNFWKLSPLGAIALYPLMNEIKSVVLRHIEF